jgi:hypothetical protein
VEFGAVYSGPRGNGGKVIDSTQGAQRYCVFACVVGMSPEGTYFGGMRNLNAEQQNERPGRQLLSQIWSGAFLIVAGALIVCCVLAFVLIGLVLWEAT